MSFSANDYNNLEEFIIKVARTKKIFNLRSYNLNIISNYERFFNFILPKDATDILIVLPLDEEKAKSIKDAVTSVRGKASITIMYSRRIRDKIIIGWYPSNVKEEYSITENSNKNKLVSSTLLKPLRQGIHLNLYSLYITF
ncbi:DUF4898 domain-containing protein [Saccharolobus caldissimus]|uniref:Uncharacterized protein n=1 Tax=Saccharolobus caldissimus TaxID=1702097 RepID=A0AAQ4CU12_9CREN|nr:DUF4898 domain-containing protein [Saccharolobus caldissimus]BDB99293.1 hypothetical protein SACC_23100 [Saccharolobus caldissimus]